MLQQLHETCRRLLSEGAVKVVIGYGQTAGQEDAHPVFITRPEDVERLVWNDRCFANLTKYLLRPEIAAMGKAAICVKGCDERALVVLEKESQIDRSQIVVIGLTCRGVGCPPSAKCVTCDVPVPRQADEVIGAAPTESQPAEAKGRYTEVEAFLLEKTPQERWAYWMDQLSRCVKCYACRQVCPMCYCRQCLVDKNRPVVFSTAPTPQANLAWHITRAFHLAGRCIGCDECTRVCPAGINLRLLNLALAQAAESNFHFRAGCDPEAEPILGAYSQQDREEFIR